MKSTLSHRALKSLFIFLRKIDKETFYSPTSDWRERAREFKSLGIKGFARQPSLLKMPLKNCDRTYEVDTFWRMPNYHYVPDYHGRSAHKHLDIRQIEGFGDLASATIAERKTLLYYDRLHIIYQALESVARSLAPTTSELEATPLHFAEVGVFRGGTSRFIALAARQLQLAPFYLHSFDTFEGHAEEDVQEIDSIHVERTKFHDTDYEVVKQYLSDVQEIQLYKGRFQDRQQEVQDKQFHFAHLDMDIYEPTLYALRFFDERMRNGSVIVIDDYGFVTCDGARLAVDEFLTETPHYFKMHLLTGQCVLVKNV